MLGKHQGQSLSSDRRRCLIDDSLFMAERWRLAENVGDLAPYPDGVQGFNAYPTGLAHKANAQKFEFLRDALR